MHTHWFIKKGTTQELTQGPRFLSCRLGNGAKSSNPLVMPWSFLQPAPILRLPRVPQSAVISLAYKRHSMATESLRVLRVVCGTTPPPKSLQSCPTLCDPIDGSPPGSSVPGILQARILEWVAVSFPNAWKWKVKGKLLSHIRLLATPWAAAYQALPSKNRK